jgi:hypothetical protein
MPQFASNYVVHIFYKIQSPYSLEDIPRLVYLLHILYYSNLSFSLLEIKQHHDCTQTINKQP